MYFWNKLIIPHYISYCHGVIKLIIQISNFHGVLTDSLEHLSHESLKELNETLCLSFLPVFYEFYGRTISLRHDAALFTKAKRP